MEQELIKETTYCQETAFCDFSNSAVSSLAKKLANGETDDRKITEAVFKHVRDKIRFGFDVVQKKASETLAKGYGVCCNKSLLLIALLRSNGIPARLAYFPVKREFIEPVMGDAHQILPETINHGLAQVLLDGEWINLEPVLDNKTYQKFYVPHKVAWSIDWDGKSSMQLYTENIAGPVEICEDIDAAIRDNVGNHWVPPESDAEAIFGPTNQQMWQVVYGISK